MNIDVNIEQLILDGIYIPHGQRPHLKTAVETELARLLAAGGLPHDLMAGGPVPHVHTGGIQLTTRGNPNHLGQQIAQAAYGGLVSETTGNNSHK